MIILVIFLASRQKWYLKYRHICLNNFSRGYWHRRTMGPGFYLYLLCTQMKLTDLLACPYFSKTLHLTEIYITSFLLTCCSTFRGFKYGNVLCFFSLAKHCPNHAPHSPLPYDCIIPRGQLIFTMAVWCYLLIILSTLCLKHSTFVYNKCLMIQLLSIM